MTSIKTRLMHSSIYADNPEKAAKDLSKLISGSAKPFHPCEGAWICFLNDEDWQAELIEFYPKSIRLCQQGDEVVFRAAQLSDTGVGTHFNLHIPKSRAQLEKTAHDLNLRCSWRTWAGLLDVWLEQGILIECKPTDIA